MFLTFFDHFWPLECTKMVKKMLPMCRLWPAAPIANDIIAKNPRKKSIFDRKMTILGCVWPISPFLPELNWAKPRTKNHLTRVFLKHKGIVWEVWLFDFGFLKIFGSNDDGVEKRRLALKNSKKWTLAPNLLKLL